MTHKTHDGRQVWIHVAPIVAAGRLKALFLECSYGDDRASDKLYGHLNPQLFMQELGVLARLVEAQPGARPGGLLKGLKVVVTHIKADDLIYHKPVPAVATIQRCPARSNAQHATRSSYN
jgi:cAMP phosphodiesterase